MPINEDLLFSKIEHLVKRIKAHNDEIRRNEQNRRSFVQLALDVLSKQKTEEPVVELHEEPINAVDKARFVDLALDVLSQLSLIHI